MSDPGDDERRGGVQSVHRALDLLEVLASRGGALGIGEIADVTGLALPTTHRLVRTLVDRGYVRQLDDRRYALGFGLVPLGSAAGSAVGAGTGRLLGRLVDELGETANLAVLDGDHVAYVAQVPGRHSMRMFTEVGRRVEPHCTAVGKAILATMSEADARAVVARTGLPRRTTSTLTDPDGLVAELALVRERGYALDEEEQEVGVRCVAVVVPGTPVPLGVSVSGPAPRMTDALVSRAVPLLHLAAHHLAAG
ncbi:IclR family transcriptional regulator [Solicola sp. PLA-1-18]|uniref:IclR family transcriptional regulator n=1 Tax=Solicola sp. PLA-1-18 TaxID=3380532 RepID=UPI003B81DD4B